MIDEAPANRKRAMRQSGKILRAFTSVIDPRAWLHLLKLVNFYNYSHVQPLRKLQLGRNPNISPDVSFSHPERIRIGDDSRIGMRCVLWAGPGEGTITIGDDVLIGPEVMLTAATYDFDAGGPVTDQPMREANIEIGNDVWLATRAIVLPGSSIGDGAIIAAGAVVKGAIPPYSIAAGSPAEVVGSRRNNRSDS